jgi:hypothetical protein
MKYFLIVFISLFLFSSCATQKVVTPPDKPVVLATTDMQCVETARKRNWYFFWGLASLDKDDTTAELLTDVNKPVKIEVTTTFTDAMLSIFTVWASFLPETTIVYECSSKK